MVSFNLDLEVHATNCLMGVSHITNILHLGEGKKTVLPANGFQKAVGRSGMFVCLFLFFFTPFAKIT